MKLGRQHVIVSLMLLAGSIVYNIWVFTRPAPNRSAAATQPPASTPAPTSAAAPAAAFDPSHPQQLPDVELIRVPVWARNPFEHRGLKPAIVQTTAAETPSPASAPAADPEIASILHSPERRLALIDGRIVRVGDMVADSKVVDILPKAVVLESAARGRRTLALKSPGSGTKTP